MKYLLALLFCLGFMSTINSYGQEKTKKVVIVKKTVDKNGKTVTERKEASGVEADILIKELIYKWGRTGFDEQ